MAIWRSATRTAHALNSGILATGSRRWIGEQVGGALGEVEGHEHDAGLDPLRDLGLHVDLPAAAATSTISPFLHAQPGRVLRVHLDQPFRVDGRQARGATGQRAGVIVPQHAARREQQRIFGVGQLGRRQKIHRRQLAQPAANLPTCRIGVPGCFSSGQGHCRPSRAILQPVVSDAAVARRQRGDLVHDLGRTHVVPRPCGASSMAAVCPSSAPAAISRWPSSAVISQSGRLSPTGSAPAGPTARAARCW